MAVPHRESFLVTASWSAVALCNLFLAIVLYKSTRIAMIKSLLEPRGGTSSSVPFIMGSMDFLTGCFNSGTVYLRLMHTNGLAERLLGWKGDEMDWLVVFLTVVMALAAALNFAGVRAMVKLHCEMKRKRLRVMNLEKNADYEKAGGCV